MKKTTAFCLIVLLATGFLFCGYFESHYTREARVCTVNDEVIIFTDRQGNFWEWENKGEEVYLMGEPVKLKMFNSYTINESTDDVVTEVIKLSIDK